MMAISLEIKRFIILGVWFTSLKKSSAMRMPSQLLTAAWNNTSSNHIVRDLIERADTEGQREIEVLMNGGIIRKKVREDITYADIYQSEKNLWNFLFFTGYLKQVSIDMEARNCYITMAIPNEELLYIYENTVENWFREEIKQTDLSLFRHSMLEGEPEIFEQEIERLVIWMVQKAFIMDSYLDSWRTCVIMRFKTTFTIDIFAIKSFLFTL